MSSDGYERCPSCYWQHRKKVDSVAAETAAMNRSVDLLHGRQAEPSTGMKAAAVGLGLVQILVGAAVTVVIAIVVIKAIFGA